MLTKFYELSMQLLYCHNSHKVNTIVNKAQWSRKASTQEDKNIQDNKGY